MRNAVGWRCMGHRLGRRRLAATDVASIVTPQTPFLRWHRQLIARKWNAQRGDEAVVRACSRENPALGGEDGRREPDVGYNAVSSAAPEECRPSSQPVYGWRGIPKSFMGFRRAPERPHVVADLSEGAPGVRIAGRGTSSRRRSGPGAAW